MPVIGLGRQDACPTKDGGRRSGFALYLINGALRLRPGCIRRLLVHGNRLLGKGSYWLAESSSDGPQSVPGRTVVKGKYEADKHCLSLLPSINSLSSREDFQEIYPQIAQMTQVKGQRGSKEKNIVPISFAPVQSASSADKCLLVVAEGCAVVSASSVDLIPLVADEGCAVTVSAEVGLPLFVNR